MPMPQFETQDLRVLRGEADTAALRLRYHDETVYRRQRPSGPSSSQLFDAAEQSRVEAIGSRLLAGVASNLSDYQEARARDKGFHLVSERDESQIPDAVGLILREKLTGQPPPASSCSDPTPRFPPRTHFMPLPPSAPCILPPVRVRRRTQPPPGRCRRTQLPPGRSPPIPRRSPRLAGCMFVAI